MTIPIYFQHQMTLDSPTICLECRTIQSCSFYIVNTYVFVLYLDMYRSLPLHSLTILRINTYMWDWKKKWVCFSRVHGGLDTSTLHASLFDMEDGFSLVFCLELCVFRELSTCFLPLLLPSLLCEVMCYIRWRREIVDKKPMVSP